MINGSHVVVFTKDAEADRLFFRDVLKMSAVDAGGGWFIFALPPAEVACHPSESNNRHELYLMCDDLAYTVKELKDLGVACGGIEEEIWGTLTKIQLPGGGTIGLYQPKHPTAF